jgi:predicted transcriptional regulator
MKELEDLTELEQVLLLACCDANSYAIQSHVPKEAIFKRVKGVQMRFAKKAFKTLITSGFIMEHKAGRSGNTYNLSPKGLKAGNKLRRRARAERPQ